MIFVAPWIPAAIGAGAGLLGTVWSNKASAREAARNRAFQEKMSSTAHQREIRDLRAAGINPLLKGLSGAATPAGAQADIKDPSEGAARGASSALAVKMQQAQLDLVAAQAEKTRTESTAIKEEWEIGAKGGRLRAESDLAKLTLEHRRQLFPILVEQARAEIERTTSSARAAEARAMLDEAAREGALNAEEWERRIGEMGPAIRMLFEFFRSAPLRRR